MGTVQAGVVMSNVLYFWITSPTNVIKHKENVEYGAYKTPLMDFTFCTQ